MAKDVDFLEALPATLQQEYSEGKNPAPKAAGWRRAANDLMDDVQQVVQAARQIDPNDCPNTIYVLCDVELVIERVRSIAADAGVKSDDIVDHIFHLEALLLAARDLGETPRATRLLLGDPITKLDQSTNLFDGGGLPDEGVPSVPGLDRAFMAGKALLADLIDDAWDADETGSDMHSLEAGYRGRGVAQDNYVLKYLDALIGDPSLVPGFSAGLTSVLTQAGNVMDSGGHIRSLTYEDCKGGPNVKYMNEADPDPADGSASKLDRVIVDVKQNLVAISELKIDAPDVVYDVVRARELTVQSQDVLRVEDAKAKLQEVRAAVYEARNHPEMWRAEEIEKIADRPEAAARLLAVHKALNSVLGGQTAEEKDATGAPNPLRAALDVAGDHLESFESIPPGNGNESRHNRIKSADEWLDLQGIYYQASFAERRGHDEEAERLLLELRNRLAEAADAAAKGDSGRTLLLGAVEGLDDYLASPGRGSGYEDEFTAGLSIAADMIDQGYRLAKEQSDDYWLDAESRAGTAQHDFVRSHFARVKGSPGKLDGFLAALTQFLGCAEVMTLIPDAYRKTWAEYAGHAPAAQMR